MAEIQVEKNVNDESSQIVGLKHSIGECVELEMIAEAVLPAKKGKGGRRRHPAVLFLLWF